MRCASISLLTCLSKQLLEAEWLELAQEGKTVDVTIEVLYGDATIPNRPTGIGVTYEINGVVQPEKEFVNGR